MAKLYFKYGTMGSSKSADLLQTVYNYEKRGLKTFIIKPDKDLRDKDEVKSRIGLTRKADLVLKEEEKLYKFLKFENIDIILVDEAQFLTKEQINELYCITKIQNIPVICYGLRCDFKMRGFEGSIRLLEVADEIVENKIICKCGRKATQNIRFVNNEPVFEGEQLMFENTEEEITYDSVCGACYLKMLESKTRRK